MTGEVEHALAEFERTGDAREARTLLAVVRTQGTFAAETPWYWQARRLLLQDRWDEAIRMLEEWLPAAFFSPDVHVMLAYSYGEIGQKERQAEQTRLADAALAAIRATGRGTPDRPWEVLRVVDEYAVLADAGLTCVGQRLQGEGGEDFDVLLLDDGSERWFRGRWFDGDR